MTTKTQQPVTRAAVLAAAKRKWPDGKVTNCYRLAGVSGLPPLCRLFAEDGNGNKYLAEARTWAEILARIEDHEAAS